MKPQNLIIKGARENNLKNLCLELEHDRLNVVTGVSGSGKSSLAFSTVFAEGQRRYIETFSPYTRQFFDKVKKPTADFIANVRPAIAIQQRTRITSSRSSVGSLTNINDYLKILWANLSRPVCPECGVELEIWDAPRLAERLKNLCKLKPESTFLVAARIEVGTLKSSLQKETERLGILGYSRFFDPERGQVETIEEKALPPLDPELGLIVVLDRIRAQSFDLKSAKDSLSQAFSMARQGCLIIEIPNETSPHRKPYLRVNHAHGQLNQRAHTYTVMEFSSVPSCRFSKLELERPQPALFSFNHPFGACPACRGFGNVLAIDPKRCVPKPSLSLEEGALACWNSPSTRSLKRRLLQFCATRKIPLDLPWSELKPEHQDLIFNHKSREYVGVNHWFKRLERKAYKMHVRVFLARFRGQFVCPTCHGTRLKPSALAYQINGTTLPNLWHMPVDDLTRWLENLQTRLKTTLAPQLQDVLSACLLRLGLLIDLGLPYLTLDRQARTLSGGETQRVNLAAAIGSDLISTHFVLDEPSVGLHPHDTNRLISAVTKLTSRGNSVLMVEHDLDCIASAQNIIEIGPGAGEKGGEIVFNGPSHKWKGIHLTPPKLVESPGTPTAKLDYLSIRNATARNLKGINLDIPMRAFTCLSGISGSGKSTLVTEVILRAWENLQAGISSSQEENVVEGLSSLDQVLLVDQSALSKTPRANIGTYTKIWDVVRRLFAATPAAEQRALSASAFSFNVEGGRCPACQGAGFIREDMQFLSDVYLPCELCLGKRFQAPVLEILYRGCSVHDLLNMSVARCAELFSDQPLITAACHTLTALGLDYLTLGHPLSELSGGEAQRLKLVPFVQEAKGHTLLIFDEPTTGLHYHDVERLIALCKLLVSKGHTLICVEHNLSLIAAADWIVDLGPEGGMKGGYLVKEGTPFSFVHDQDSNSLTASHLKRFIADAARTNGTGSKTTRKTSPSPKAILIQGAREHNLKNINVEIPLNQIVAITGVSGSGKSSIAKDIVYAEGQRRYLDCLSPYARQFIKELKKPDIDRISNVKPTICVYQHTFQPSRLSTLATMSETYNFLRLLYSKTATQVCPDHPEHAVSHQSADSIASEIKRLKAKVVRILAPVINHKKGNHKAIIARALASEVSELRVDGNFLSPGKVSEGLERTRTHSIDFTMAKFNPARMEPALISDAVAQALSLSAGTLIVHTEEGEEVFSMERSCPVCKKGFFKPDPEDLSFHSTRGACPKCAGFGVDRRGHLCPACQGARINSNGRHLLLGGKNIHEACLLTPSELCSFLKGLNLDPARADLAAPILSELFSKLETLQALGLDYLVLDRECSSLSSGELQRLRLAAAMGSSLTSVLYIFDEPSANLHPLDNAKVLDRLRDLKQRGNSVIVIEHDAASILACEHVIDVGPGGGHLGGEIVFSGPLSAFLKCDRSLTAQSIRSSSTPPLKSRLKLDHTLSVNCAPLHNIKSLKLDLPLGCILTVAGVSGAGKSTLVHGIISDTILNGQSTKKSAWKKCGTEIKSTVEIERLLLVDQQPIGHNPRSTPMSYLGIGDHIRKLFAQTIDAKSRGWSASFFSYNSGQGRCPNCKGRGDIKLEMSFLPEAHMPCEICHGKRFREEADSVRFLGLSISEVLGLTIQEACQKFANHRKIHQVLYHACEIGLGYLTLGQSSTTLSGGESQRLKLVAELGASRKGHTLYVLDEPTTGLHKSDVMRLLKILKSLTASGNSVLLIEHDVDIINASDYVLELGPGPAEKGGKVIFQGTPHQLLKAKTPWGKLLRDYACAENSVSYLPPKHCGKC
ncbi:MAG: excinuclease ABC subunit UvrA [Deltaproteobacteria bacterium]|nr:excinuclease ABC subunit UvrA [Deltaproteobacteria bacterium]